jgi:hypothetical protein
LALASERKKKYNNQHPTFNIQHSRKEKKALPARWLFLWVRDPSGRRLAPACGDLLRAWPSGMRRGSRRLKKKDFGFWIADFGLRKRISS